MTHSFQAFRRVLPGVSCLALLVGASPALAEAGLSLTVTAPRPTLLPQEQTTGAVSSMGATEITQQQLRRTEDVLNQIPGITLTGQRGLGQPQSVSLRGLGRRNVRIFLDGVEITDTSQAQAHTPLGGLNMADVERIEVLRGPQPGRFGANAGAGVINIETKRPTEPFAGVVGVEGGSYGTRRAHTAVSGLQGRVDYRVSAEAMASDGYSDFNKRRGGTERDPYEQWSLAGRLGIQASDTLRFDLTARYSEDDLHYDANTGDRNWNRDETRRFLRASATLDSFGGSLTHVVGISDSLTTRAFWGENGGVERVIPDTYDGSKRRADYRGTWQVLPQTTMEFGADATREAMTQHTPYFAPATPHMSRHFNLYGGYATLGTTPLEGLDLTASLRGEDHQEFGNKATWRLAAAYTVAATDTTLRSSIGTAWQTPSLYERFDPCYGRASLRPEHSRGWDVGVDQAVLGGLGVVSTTYFNTRTRDQINWQWSPAITPGCAGGEYVNIDRTRVQGVEAEIVAQLTPSLDLRASYTFQEPVNALTGTRLRSFPRHQASGAIGWAFLPGAHGVLTLRYRDDIDNWGKGDEFWTADVRLSYALTEAVTLTGRVENLFGYQYEESFGYGTPGRSAYVGTQIRF